MSSVNHEIRDTYWEAYGMTHDPFAALSDRYFYPLPEWDEQAQLLEHTTLYNNLFVVVQGPRGSGKTTFMEQLQQRLSPSVACYQIDGDPELSPDELLQIIGHAYSLPDLPLGRLPLLDLYKLQLAQVGRSARHCVLMIDDAHLLPPETLNVLFMCVKEQGQMPAYFHLVLFAEPTIHNWISTLDHEDNETYLQEMEMPRLDSEMAEKYLEHRLRSSGLREELPISSEDIEKITEEAHGLIGEINHLCKNHLLSLGSPKRRFLNSSVVSRSALMVGVAMMLVVAVGYFVWMEVTPNAEPATAELTSPTPSVALLPKPDTLKEALPVQRSSEPEELVSSIEPVRPDELVANELPSEIASIDAAQLELKPVAVAPIALPVKKPDVVAQVAPPVKKPDVVAQIAPPVKKPDALAQIAPPVKKPDAVSQVAPPVKKPDVVAQVAPPVKQPDAVAQVAPPVKKPDVVAQVATPVKKPVVVARVAASVKKPVVVAHVADPVKKPVVAGHTKTLAQSGYVIQVFATHEKASAEKFIHLHDLQGKAKLYPAKFAGKPGFLVLVGQYSTEHQARAGVASLSNKVKQLHPWVRAMKGIV